MWGVFACGPIQQSQTEKQRHPSNGRTVDRHTRPVPHSRPHTAARRGHPARGQIQSGAQPGRDNSMASQQAAATKKTLLEGLKDLCWRSYEMEEIMKHFDEGSQAVLDARL